MKATAAPLKRSGGSAASHPAAYNPKKVGVLPSGSSRRAALDHLRGTSTPFRLSLPCRCLLGVSTFKRRMQAFGLTFHNSGLLTRPRCYWISIRGAPEGSVLSCLTMSLPSPSAWQRACDRWWMARRWRLSHPFRAVRMIRQPQKPPYLALLVSPPGPPHQQPIQSLRWQCRSFLSPWLNPHGKRSWWFILAERVRRKLPRRVSSQIRLSQRSVKTLWRRWGHRLPRQQEPAAMTVLLHISRKRLLVWTFLRWIPSAWARVM